MDKPVIAYAPRANALPETEITVLASIYRFILDCPAKKKAVEPAPEPDGRNDGTKLQGDSADAQIISR